MPGGGHHAVSSSMPGVRTCQMDCHAGFRWLELAAVFGAHRWMLVLEGRLRVCVFNGTETEVRHTMYLS